MFLTDVCMRWMLAFVSIFLMSSCFVTRSEGDQMLADMSRIKDEIASMQRERYDSLQQVNNHIKDIKSRTSSLEKNTFKQNADTSLEKEKFVSEIQQLRGQLEETQHHLGEVQSSKESATAGADGVGAKDMPLDKADHFVFAKKFYDNKQYGEAIAALDSFLERFKDDKQFLNQVFFLKGDAYFEQAKNADKEADKKALYKKAVLSFQEVLTRFPNSNKVPESLYKVGNSLSGMGFPKDAAVFYEEIINKHSKSSFVKDAKAKLEKLKSGKKKA